MEKKERLPRILRLSTTILALLAGVFLLVALGRIYFSSPGDGHKFTSGSVGLISVFLYLALSLFLLGVGISIFLGIRYPENKVSYGRSLQEEYLSVRKYHSLDQLTDQDKKAFLGLERKNRIALIVFSLLCLILLVFPIGYLVQIRHFNALGDLTENTISLVIHTLPFLLGIYLLAVLYLYYRDRIIRRQMELLKKSQGVLPGKKDRKKEEIIRMIIQFSFLLVAITFIIIGIVNGEANNVLLKAINICTECIGLG